jgi:phosphopantetheinyl transferase
MDFKQHRFEINASKINLLEFNDDFNPEKYLDSLTAIEVERYFSFKHLKRRKEFVATRLLKHQLFGYQEIEYRIHGAPFINDCAYISVSHANNIVGIASNNKHEIGFDIECITDRTKNIFPKYLNDFEMELFDTRSAFDLTLAWSLKESMYKLAGRKLIDFKKDLLLLEKKDDLVRAKICDPDKELFLDLDYFQVGNNIVTINKNELKCLSILQSNRAY